MNLVQKYDTLTQNLRHNPNDIASLGELILLYPHAKNTFDYEITNSIELYVDNFGHNQATADFLTQQVRQNPQDKTDFSDLLDGLYATKTIVLTELKTYQSYTDIECFFDFILDLKTSKNIELVFLVNLLTELSSEINPNNLTYTILTDTLDYMTGWYSLNSIVPDKPIANFIENLKNPLSKNDKITQILT